MFELINDSYYRKQLSTFTEGSKILIIGDPKGKVKELATLKGLLPTSIDINPSVKSVLKKNIVKSGLKANHFDGVLFSHVIEHLQIPEVKKAVAEIRRVLKPGGQVLVVTPINSCIFWDDPTHVRPYTKWALRTLFSVGFTESDNFKRVHQKNLFGLKNHKELNMIFIKGD